MYWASHKIQKNLEEIYEAWYKTDLEENGDNEFLIQAKKTQDTKQKK